jgi:hypothetical protein
MQYQKKIHPYRILYVLDGKDGSHNEMNIKSALKLTKY